VHATFDMWLNVSAGPLAALVSKLMLCFHHLEQVDCSSDRSVQDICDVDRTLG